ncbi:MAG: hypothetical protein ABIC18_02490 [Candidatus Omnitrophota bacterium]
MALFAPIVHCETLSDWDWEVFYQAAEIWHLMVYNSSSDWYMDGDDFDNICQQVANKYGISVDDASDTIFDVTEYGYILESDQEGKALDELGDKLDALPDWATYEDGVRVHREVASNYGISLIQLHAIEFADEVWWWYYDYYYYY